MLNLRLTAPRVEMAFKYTIGEFTIPKKLIFPRGDIHVNFVDIFMWHKQKIICKKQWYQRYNVIL